MSVKEFHHLTIRRWPQHDFARIRGIARSACAERNGLDVRVQVNFVIGNILDSFFAGKILDDFRIVIILARVYVGIRSNCSSVSW